MKLIFASRLYRELNYGTLIELQEVIYLKQIEYVF